jgi:hypothetical protein
MADTDTNMNQQADNAPSHTFQEVHTSPTWAAARNRLRPPDIAYLFQPHRFDNPKNSAPSSSRAWCPVRPNMNVSVLTFATNGDCYIERCGTHLPIRTHGHVEHPSPQQSSVMGCPLQDLHTNTLFQAGGTSGPRTTNGCSTHRHGRFYFERQQRAFCQVHAANNARGGRVLTGEQLLAYCSTLQRLHPIWGQTYIAHEGKFSLYALNHWLYHNTVKERKKASVGPCLQACRYHHS